MATERGINKGDVIHVINYLNDIGVILHLPNNKKLRNTVITNVHMLIGMFMKIITVVKPNDVDKVPVMMKYWHKLDEEGILEEKLLRYFWRNELFSSKDKEAIFEDFIELMKAFGLLFEKNESSEGGRLFVVPSRMKTTTDARLEIKGDEKHTVSIYVTPKNFLPDAVYDILIVGFVNLSQAKGCRDDPKLFQNQSEIGFDERHYLRLGRISIDNTNSLKIEISRRREKDERDEDKPPCKPHPIVCMEVLHVLRQHLDEVYPSKKVVGYALKILCSICSTLEKPHFQELENCLKYDLMTCDKSSGNTAMSTADVQNLFVEDWYVVSERNNFHSIQFIIVDLGTEQMRMFFMKESHLQRKSDVGKFLIEQKNTALKDVDLEGQESNVFSPDAEIDKFDMTTLLLLIRYCFYPSKEEYFWENPPADDNSDLANLVRIYRYKRNFLDCSCSNRISDEEFDHRWKELTALFTGVGVPVENVEKYRYPWRRTGKLMDTDHNLFIEERANFSAINSLVYDVGTQQMRCFFLSQTKLKESDVATYLIGERNKGRLKSVKFFEDEKKKLFRKKADINTFDITIMMKLIRHCCTWPSLNDFFVTPNESFFNKLANLVRIHQYRNNHLAHCPNTRMSNTKFDQDWHNLTDYLMKAGADSREIKICEKLHNAWTASVT